MTLKFERPNGRRFMFVVAVSILIAVAGSASAQKMHKWVDEAGNVHYSQTPPEDQARHESQRVTYGDDRPASADPECCQRLRTVAEDVGNLLLQGMETTDIYRSLPPSEYPEITEVVNFVSGRTYGGYSVSEVGSLAQSACMNSTFEACRLPPGGSASSGTGSMASATLVADGIVLTNEHAVRSCDRISIGERGTPARLLKAERGLDLALLEVSVQGSPVEIGTQPDVVLGEPVTVAGYPLATMLGGLNVTTGAVSAETGARQQTGLFQISAAVQPGSSGGPVLNAAGQLIGIVVARLSDEFAFSESGAIPQNVNFAISPSVVRAFLDRNGIGYRKADARMPLEGTEIAAVAREFTFPVRCDN